MNSSLSDGNENVIDIFVLSTSSSDSPVQTGDLERPGYRITFFSDGHNLFETLRSGKPNLLICDSVTFHDESFELCRAIKEDFDLWVVPVLIVTGASNLSDLLHVLDCNADNFISHPYDPAYLSSLIEGMLATPVQRPTPEQIKTQFKIQHDDHLFVVTADRRKLLEFLLSSFEIAVTRSEDVTRMAAEHEDLARSLRRAEDQTREKARSVSILEGTVQLREQAISALTTEINEKTARIQEQADEIERLSSEIESGKNHIVSAEEQILRITRESEDLAHRYTTETRDLNQQLQTLSEQMEKIDAELKDARDALTVETNQRADTNKHLSEMTSRCDQAEKTVQALTLECEQVRAALAAEKDRVQSAEYDLNAMVQAKTESEQNLTRTIGELKDTARQQAEDLARRRAEIESGSARIAELESRVAGLARENERAENELQSRTDAFSHERADLEEALITTRTSLAEREREIAEMKDTLQTARESIEATNRDLAALSREFEDLKGTLAQEREDRRLSEERLNDIIRERESSLQALRGDHQNAQSELDEHRGVLARLRSDLDAALTTRSEIEESLDSANARIRQLEAGLDSTTSERDMASQQIQSLGVELEKAHAELEAAKRVQAEREADLIRLKQECETISRNLGAAGDARAEIEKGLGVATTRIRELEAELDAAASERTAYRQQIRSLGEELESARAERETAFVQLKQESDSMSLKLETAGATRTGLENALSESAARIRDIEDQLAAATATAEDRSRQIEALTGEMERVKDDLSESTKLRLGSEEQASARMQEIERIAGDLQKVSAERSSLESILAQERELRTGANKEISRLRDCIAAGEAEEKAREISCSARMRELEAELETSRERERVRDGQLADLAREKQLAVEAATSLSAEIEQARTALADEWENHMNAEEQLGAAVREKQQKAQPVPQSGELESEKTRKRSLIVKGPDLPVTIGKLPHTMSVLPTDIPAKPPVPRITNVEDLFEDEEIAKVAQDEMPSVSIIHEPSEFPGDEMPPDEGMLEDMAFPETGTDSAGSDIAGEDDDGDTGEPGGDEEYDQGEIRPPGSIPYGFAFNRAQWLDLLKWAHHSGTLSQEQRMQIVRMGRLIQKGRKLTQKQEEQVREILSLAQAQGYRFI